MNLSNGFPNILLILSFIFLLGHYITDLHSNLQICILRLELPRLSHLSRILSQHSTIQELAKVQ